MSSITVPVGNTLEIIGVDSVRYKGTVYNKVTSIRLADGTTTTPEAMLQAAGGVFYSSNELKRCVKVEAYDPDINNRAIFTCYSTNSRQVTKNAVGSVPGGLWVEMFNFIGDRTTNGIFNLWELNQPVAGRDYLTTWIGFKLNYGVVDTRTYVLTQTNDFLEESIPSPPVQIDVTFMHDVKISGKFVAPVYNSRAFRVPIHTFNLYRSNVTADGFAQYQRVPVTPRSVAPIPINLVTYGPFPAAVYRAYPYNFSFLFGWEMRDDVLASDLGVTLPSLDWDAPPERGLKGLTAWRNGMLAAFNDNLIYFCEPFRPHAWPQKYIIAIPFKVLALVVDENALIAITDRNPYIFTGSHPSNVTYEHLENVEAGLAAAPNSFGFAGPSRAVTKTPQGIIYGSNEGPVQISSGRAQVLGRQFFTREEWASRYSFGYGHMHLAYSDGRLLCYFDNGVGGFYCNIDNAQPQLVEFQPMLNVVNHFILPHDDSLYVVSALTAGSTVARFADENMPRQACYYTTRDVYLPTGENFGAIQIWGYGPALTTALILVFGGGVLEATISLTFALSTTMADTVQPFNFRLRGGIKHRRWRVQIVAQPDQVFRTVHLASTYSALATLAP